MTNSTPLETVNTTDLVSNKPPFALPTIQDDAEMQDTNVNLLESLPSIKDFRVIKRNGTSTDFDPGKISLALSKCFVSIEGSELSNSLSFREKIETITQGIVLALQRSKKGSKVIHIEDIQDYVELGLMRAEEHKAARAYVLYRDERTKARSAEKPAPLKIKPLMVKHASGTYPLDTPHLLKLVREACGVLSGVSAEEIVTQAVRDCFENISIKEVGQALVLSARSKIEKEPNYTYVAARLLLANLYSEALEFLGINKEPTILEMKDLYGSYFKLYVERGIKEERISPHLSEYNLEKLACALKPERDLQFDFLGMQTLYDRYFLHSKDIRFELPQAFFMRVAMGLATNESLDIRDEKVIEFYNLLSSFDFMSSTPTLFNSGTTRPQLSSCYLSSVPDDLYGIFGAIQDNAMLSKFAGGLGNDWTPVRGQGGWIKGTNGKSSGVVPFLKIANDTCVAVNQGGKRKGALCAYLETWHRDIEEFLELRKNTGDDRRRAHDMDTANWVPDLFMERVISEGEWTLFSPEETPDLHTLTGAEFKSRYEQYEKLADEGQIVNYKRIQALGLWRKMLAMLFETGHPWITFKDPCNLRSPQQHVGTVNSSNLCTEITLNTKPGEEIAVCNLGSINLPAHMTSEGILDLVKLEKTINTAMRMLDNVIDYNYYSVPTARSSNLKHRPVGMGIMGFHDCLYKMKVPYDSKEAVEFADTSMELVSWYAIKASSALAAERGSYESYSGSLWSKGILPIDSIEILEKSRPVGMFQQNKEQKMPWDSIRSIVQTQGMRNSNILAIAPTATISNIVGVSQSIDPTYQNLYVKSNMSGDFTVINKYLVDDLKELGLWDEVMAQDLKFTDGSASRIDRIPEKLRALYKCAFEMDSHWYVEAGSRRQKWIDQAQSLNLYMLQPSGRKLDELYKAAWLKGLKTTYYLRTQGATHTEKTTITDSRLNAVQVQEFKPEQLEPKVCSILDPTCESCQ